MKAADLLLRRRRARAPAPIAPDRTRITQVFRNAPQMRAVARLLRALDQPSLRVAIYGVADGAEAVSLLMTLDPATAPVDLRIDGRDINPEYLRFAEAFAFPANHFAPGHSPEEYPAYLEQSGGEWCLKRRWRPSISYDYGNVLTLPSGTGTVYDAVLCQNMLVSFSPDDCAAAVQRLASLVRPGGLLVIGGGPLDRIPGLVAAEGFSPILDDAEAVHEAWTVQRRFYAHGKRPYWALEPFDRGHADGPGRYATIFRKAEG